MPYNPGIPDPTDPPPTEYERMLDELEKAGCDINEQEHEQLTGGKVTRWVVTDDHGDELASGYTERIVIARAHEAIGGKTDEQLKDDYDDAANTAYEEWLKGI